MSLRKVIRRGCSESPPEPAGRAEPGLALVEALSEIASRFRASWLARIQTQGEPDPNAKRVTCN